jgi:hypothetical protein
VKTFLKWAYFGKLKNKFSVLRKLGYCGHFNLNRVTKENSSGEKQTTFYLFNISKTYRIVLDI